MNIFESIFLGAIQGLTEFIPVSSSGHLELMPKIFGISEPSTSFITFLHFGTLLALVFYYRSKLSVYVYSLNNLLKSSLKKDDGENLKLIRNIIISTLPALVIGLLLSGFIEMIYDAPENTRLATLLTAIAMIGIGIIFIFSNRIFKNKKFNLDKLTSKYAFIIGVAQAFALLRGVSRSGITLLAGQAVGLNRVSAAEFGFLMSIPITFLAALIGSIDMLGQEASDLVTNLPIYLGGLLSSFIFGYIAIHFMISFLKKRGLRDFGIYRIVFGILAILIIL